MVFLTALNFIKRGMLNRGPDPFWRKRRIFRLTAHFKNRKQNCYSLAIRGAHRALQYCSVGRKQKREDFKELWNTRLDGAAAQFNMPRRTLVDGLTKCDILLSRKTLTELAAWEPRTFKSLAMVGLARAKYDGQSTIKDIDPPAMVITQGMIKE